MLLINLPWKAHYKFTKKTANKTVKLLLTKIINKK